MELEAQIELERIEYKYRTWNSKFKRELEIFLAIAEMVNSKKGNERKHWCLVMELYNKKYR